MKRFCAAIASLVIAVLGTPFGAEAAPPIWDMDRLAKPPKTFPAEKFSAPGMESLFLEGLPYQGRPTRVFAWLGLPKNASGKKCPGMVLIHGGGGTAFDAWVRLWNERGYAAIAMDTCGCTPGGDHQQRPRHPDGGPGGWGGFQQINEPIGDQWTYHAVASAILAHSLLRSRAEVDPDRIGLTGISWGGYLTCIVAGVDSRFKLAAPVYGCGFYGDTVFNEPLQKQGPENAARWLQRWDPSHYLPAARMPMLWVTGSNDFAYPLNALQKSYRVAGGDRTLCVRLRMPHAHGGPGESPKEIQVFADRLLRQGAPLAKITECRRRGTDVSVTFESQDSIVKAELNYTRDEGPWSQRRWESVAARLDGRQARAVLPEGTKVWYLNLFDRRDCVVSTEHETLP